jgi:hypothetical protein
VLRDFKGEKLEAVPKFFFASFLRRPISDPPGGPTVHGSTLNQTPLSPCLNEGCCSLISC